MDQGFLRAAERIFRVAKLEKELLETHQVLGNVYLLMLQRGCSEVEVVVEISKTTRIPQEKVEEILRKGKQAWCSLQ